ncbi:MAG TPA: ATP-binding cassette domain-containing protein, partial [Dehalococcoidia bacterium]|nr:ATP-binding cassette domain-containing protein [Dehalococcoidia bacterium]
MALLEVESVVAGYGGIMAIRGVSLNVEDGEIVGLIGSNGAGKSTTLRTITGLVRRRAGRVRFGGQDLGKMHPHEIAGAGISLVPEGRGIFHRLSVTENLSMGAFNRSRGADVDEDYETVFTLFPRLK